MFTNFPKTGLELRKRILDLSHLSKLGLPLEGPGQNDPLCLSKTRRGL